MTGETLGRFDRFLQKLEHSAFGVIYGAITVLALLLALGHSATSPVKAALILFGSVLAITLAKTFAQVSADAARDRRGFGIIELKQGWHHAAPTLIAANVPSLMIAGAATKLYSMHTAIVLSQVYAIVLLAIYGYSIGWVIYGRVWPGLLHGAFTGAIGLVLALLKFVIH